MFHFFSAFNSSPVLASCLRRRSASSVDFNTLAGDGTVVGTYRRLTDVEQLISSSVTDVQKATDHLSQQRAFLGAQINKAELQKDALDQRIISLSLCSYRQQN